ncbi:zinc finger BED domain-containing protein RICESLEEPER 2-like [Cucumis melo var. makuwa]|uniref:Zinc finger BED domain-containing protein RICESLEEPER 2-like n=1 Tax=Cucumis melo var. makuwa TaxID=1194695 RepID=A0A5A7VIP3_CUCMM|nr:zinc finger BED domain-containing protein RICESLEEPER 2-like [Cucumis melo var. makuwa]
MTLAFKPKDKVGDNSSQHVCESFSLEGCQKALVEMIIVDELPFKFVDGKGFKKFVDILTCGNHTRFVVPSRFTVARVVLKLWNSTYMMLEASVKFEKAFDRLEDKDTSYKHDMSPNKEDWTNAKMLISGSRQGCSSTSTTSTQTISGLDANIDFDSNENVGEDFVYNTIVEEFEDDATTPSEQGSSKIDIYLLEANVRTEVSTVVFESAFSTGGRVFDSSRCLLALKTVEALICTQNWLNSDPIHH